MAEFSKQYCEIYDEDLEDFREFLGGTDDYMKDKRVFFGEAIHIR